ncbi:hypothetical protein [Nocardiopsis sp. LOL_012]|uniref:hypothetical protein n=1 Tax=Nocardiopsis sp. LOL_012 TaxID=3345409 RepID=UPI003A882F37
MDDHPWQGMLVGCALSLLFFLAAWFSYREVRRDPRVLLQVHAASLPDRGGEEEVDLEIE